MAKYGLSMMVASDDGLQTYLKKILAVKAWLEEGDVQRLVVVVAVWKSTSVWVHPTILAKSCRRWTLAFGGEEPASPPSRRRVDGVEDAAMIQHERAVVLISTISDGRRDQRNAERWTFAVNAATRRTPRPRTRGQRPSRSRSGRNPQMA